MEVVVIMAVVGAVLVCSSAEFGAVGVGKPWRKILLTPALAWRTCRRQSPLHPHKLSNRSCGAGDLTLAPAATSPPPSRRCATAPRAARTMTWRWSAAPRCSPRAQLHARETTTPRRRVDQRPEPACMKAAAFWSSPASGSEEVGGAVTVRCRPGQHRIRCLIDSKVMVLQQMKAWSGVMSANMSSVRESSV
jgi:hypothetical protein